MREWIPPSDLGPYQIHPAFESWLERGRADLGEPTPGLDAAFQFMRAEESALRESSCHEDEDPLVLTVNDLPDLIAWLVAQRNASHSRALTFFQQLRVYMEREDRAMRAPQG